MNDTALRTAAAPAGLRTSPFHPRTAALSQGQDWRRWAGCLIATQYELQFESEYAAVRHSAALFDVSPLHKARIHGPQAEALLQRVVTRDVARIRPGRVLYTCWCDEEGHVLDDGTVQRLGETDFRLTSALPALRWLEDNAQGLDVELADESRAIAALALQGPRSRAVLTAATGAAEVDQLRYFGLARAQIADVPVEISRTGYTGDLGYELWLPADAAVEVWDRLIEAGRPHLLRPAGLHALDVARIEAGLILIDVDYVSARDALIPSQRSNPWELDLGWTVDLDKGPFNGRAALRAAAAEPPAWRFVGLQVDGAALESLYLAAGLPPSLPHTAWRGSVPLYAPAGPHRGEQIGYATSGAWSPWLKSYLALGHVAAPWGAPGQRLDFEITVDHRPRRAAATLVKRPALDLPRRRSTPHAQA